MSLRKAIEQVKQNIEEDRMAGKYKKGQMIVQGQWPNPDKWAKEYIIPNADEKGVRIYAKGPSFKIEKLQEITVKDFFELRQSINEDVAYHKEMKRAHDTHSYAHENEVTNDGHPDHDYAGNEHGEAANHHQKAMDAHKKHGGDSPQYKKAAAAAHKQTSMAHMATKDAGKFKKTAKPGIKFPKKP